MTDMLQKTENVAKNVANENSQDLTKQWKKGELINGKKYYITFFDSEPFEATFRAAEAIFPFWEFEANGRQYRDENGYDCVKVLAPVPSYEELQNMNKAVNECIAANIKLVEQNKQLKELLKECEEKILLMDFDSIKIEILQKIDEVLQ